MGKVAFIGVGIWMIGTGIDGWPSIGSVVKIVGGVVVIIAALGVNF